MKKVLIVDDDAGVLKVTSTYLRKICGYETLLALNGKEGLKKILRNSDIEGILLDYNMPVMNGWEFYKNLKENNVYKKNKDTRIIAIGDFLEEQRNEFNYFVSKPFGMDELKKIKKYLNE